jgi:soluble P-type ATPase
MREIPIPGHETLRISFLVLDYNGTLACDGRILDGVRERLEVLSKSLEIHVLTADTFGSVQKELAGIPCTQFIVPLEKQAEAKASYVETLGLKRTACIGNGRNDRLMLRNAVLGIGVILQEGAFPETVLAADVVTTSILDALDLFLFPLRLAATLRS